MTKTSKIYIIIATAIVMETQFVKNCEYSEMSSSDSEIEELLKCSLKFSYVYYY